MTMNRVLTEKGQDEVRYIITDKTVCGSTVKVNEAVPLRSRGLHLLVMTAGASESGIMKAVRTVKKLHDNETVLTVYFYADALSESNIRSRISRSKLGDVCCCITSQKALRAAFDASSYVLTAPAFSANDFFTLFPAEALTLRDGKVTAEDSAAVQLVDCKVNAIAEAIAAAAAERSADADD